MNKTLEYFKEIAKIPRPSGSESKIADYVENFAKERNLLVYRDKNNNIIIKKDVSTSPLILQAHLDMVCEKEDWVKKDMTKEGVDLVFDGNILKANGTTLGADDGMGVSIILSILDEEFSHNLECVFTTEEETSMGGAKSLDASLLSGNNIIGLDGSECGVLEVSSAGFVSIKIDTTKSRNIIENFGDKTAYEIKISSLVGGHSGEDINKGRLNANLVMSQILNNAQIISFNGGSKFNVIPTSCKAVAVLSQQELKQVESKFKEIKQQNIMVEKNAKLEIEKLENLSSKMVYFQDVLSFLNQVPSGVICLENDFVITSLNVAKVSTETNEINLSLRSSKQEQEADVIKQIKTLCDKFGFKMMIVDKSPFFEFKDDTKLLNILDSAYKKLYGVLPQKKRIHAGLEGGVFAQKIENANIYVTAPNMFDLHTTSERVEIDSIEKTYNWICEVVKEYNK